MEISIDQLEVTTPKKLVDYNGICVKILYVLLFLLPIFSLPLSTISTSFNKAILLYIGIPLAFAFWLLDKLQTGKLEIPKSVLLLSSAGLVVAWLISSLTSIYPKLSLAGRGYEVDTFFAFLVMSVALFLVASLFQTEKRAFMFYILTFASGFFVFVLQFIHVVFKVNFGVLQLPTSTLVGGWNDCAIFFGFVALTSLVFFDLFKFSKKMRAVLISLVLGSLLAMLVVNFFTGWLIFGVFVLVFLVYLFSKSLFEIPIGEVAVGSRKLFHFSFFILAVVLFVLLARGTMAGIASRFDTSFVEVRPSWSTTIDVATQSLKQNPVLGSGPNTFLYEWLKYKPASINETNFWSTRFEYGIGLAPSMVATTGGLGVLALLFFFGALLYTGMKVLSAYESDLIKALTMSAFLGAAYLWSFIIFYSPSFVIFALAFLTTGLLIGMLVRVGKIKVIDISFLSSSRVGFVSVLVIVFLMIGSVSLIYFFSQKTLAVYNHEQAVKIFKEEGDIDKTEKKIEKAIRLDAWDEHYRALSELNLVKIQKLLSAGSSLEGEGQADFQRALASSIKYARESTALNPMDPMNWMQLGRVYEAIIPLGVGGADSAAIDAYNKASEVSPLDPSAPLAAARVKFQVQDTVGAREYLQSSLKLKSDFAPAVFMLSRIEVQEGNIEEATKKTEQAVLLAPDDIGVIFQLGLLYFQGGNMELGRLALEKAVELNPNYANARYFLGLIYGQQGFLGKAIEQFENIARTNPGNTEIDQILVNLREAKMTPSELGDILPPGTSPTERPSLPIGE